MSSENLWEILHDIGGGKCLAKCACGAIKQVRKRNIIDNRSLSCGCRSRSKVVRAGVPQEYSDRLIRIYNAMKQRCYNEKSTNFHNYGAKGIVICGEWLKDSTSFYLWAIDNGYTNELSIDRIDPSSEYSPDNCRWVTLSENTTRMLLDNFNKSSGQFNKDSIMKLVETNRDRLGMSLILLDVKCNKIPFRCLIEAAEYIVKEKCLLTCPRQIKKNLSACLQGKRKTCHGYKVLQVGDPYQEF